MRYVIHHHTAWPNRPDHYDLMLELEAGADPEDLALKTFASLRDLFPSGVSHSDTRSRAGQTGGPTEEVNLLRLINDHRRAYLDYQGPVSRGRGQVQRADAGTFELLRPLDPGLQEIYLRCAGGKLSGDFRLRHMGQGVYSFERLQRPRPN